MEPALAGFTAILRKGVRALLRTGLHTAESRLNICLQAGKAAPVGKSKKNNAMRHLSRFFFRLSDSESTGHVKVIHGPDGTVEIDRSTQTVVKTFLKAAPDVADRKARREVDYTSRFFAAVSGIAGLSCPRILGFDFSPPPRVITRLCPGKTLPEFLNATAKHDRALAEIASRIHDGLEIYIDTFGEPHYDFVLQNMLYDDEAGMLTLLDFANGTVDGANQDFSFDVSVGRLIGQTCYDLARPSRLTARKAAYFEVLQKVLASFDGRVSMIRVRRIAEITYNRLGARGKIIRRLYYATLGVTFARLFLSRLGLPSGAMLDNVAE